MKVGRGNGNTVQGFKTLAVCKGFFFFFLCAMMHTTFPGMGSGCFLAVNTHEEKKETGLGYQGKYEEPGKRHPKSDHDPPLLLPVLSLPSTPNRTPVQS